jgi:hypothetical protein
MINVFVKKGSDINAVNNWLQDHNLEIDLHPVTPSESEITSNSTVSKYGLTVFPVIFCYGSPDQSGNEFVKKYAEGLEAILALSPDVISEIRTHI